MKRKKKILLISSMLLTLIIVVSIVLIINKNDANEIVMKDNNKPINNSFLTLMLEQSDGTYAESTSNTWPGGNYAFNSELSRCENGGELRWDRENGIVELLSNKSDACYVYFDLYNVVQISNVKANKTYNSITVTVATSGGENPVDKYYFSIDGGNSYQESSTPSYTFSNLTMNHEYTIQVYAKDTLGYESNEETIKVTTDNYVNPVVNSVTATNVSNDSITVSVNASGGTNAIGTYMYSINNGAYQSSSLNTYTFSGLSAGQSYSIRVYVTDTNGVESNVYTINVETNKQPLTLAEACSNGNNLASCITSFYNASGSDITKIYYHNSSFTNGAEDNSYRYAGASDEVNNYVCFGSTATTCPSDYLYRIIGVFENEVKLIKYDYATTTFLGSYGSHNSLISTSNYNNYKGKLNAFDSFEWSSVSNNTWSASDLNTVNLNNYYIDKIGSTWNNKISNHTWFVGGNSTSDATSKEFYSTERSRQTWEGKIGLMYVSDYRFATSPSAWTTNMSSYNNLVSYNWMYMGITDWTIIRSFNGTINAFAVNDNGNVAEHGVHGGGGVRPCFYLTSSIKYVSGSGTSTDPIRIN